MKPQGPDKIFASTSCLSKEQLLQYTKNELSPVDKHMAEMHMVDCELCSDAVEGVVLLSGMKIVNDTISEVKKLTPKKIKPLKSSSYKIWFAAASLIFIIGTTTYLYRQVHQVPKSLLSEEKSTYTEPQVRNLPAPPEKKELQQSSLPDKNSPSEISETKDENLNKPHSSLYFSADDKNKEQDFREKSQPATKVVRVDAVASTAASEETVNSEAFDESASPATGIKEADGRRTAAQNKSSSRSQGNTIQFVEGYKTLVYNDDTSLMDSLLISDHEGVEARYENKQRKMDKKAIIPNDIHYVNYTTFLQTGIHHYKNADYKKAREIFDQIIGERKNDENALFYGGLSYAGMDQNKIALQYFQNLLKNKSSAFYEEARWNIALIYLKEKNISSSRLLLKEIYDDKGFYSIQAGEKLKELK